MKKTNPRKQCFLEQDKLYIDNKIITSNNVFKEHKIDCEEYQGK